MTAKPVGAAMILKITEFWILHFLGVCLCLATFSLITLPASHVPLIVTYAMMTNTAWLATTLLIIEYSTKILRDVILCLVIMNQTKLSLQNAGLTAKAVTATISV